MASDQLYKTKSFNLHGLEGISDKTIDLHLSLYEGYVKATNALQGRIAEFLRDEQVDLEEFPAYSELTRRPVSNLTGWCCTNIISTILRRRRL